jgi:hypothetical protein
MCSACLLVLFRMHFLLVRNEEEVFGQLATLLAALLDALSSDSERVVLQVRLCWPCTIGSTDRLQYKGP